jgi:signal peptide peptidase SppA
MIAQVLDGRIGIDATGLAKPADEASGLRPEGSRFVGQFEQKDGNDPKAGRKPYRTTADGTAIIPVIGSLTNRYAWLDAVSGITSYEYLKFQLGEAAADDAVRSILLDMDSPGGEAVGAFEAADVVRNVAAVKPVVAVVNGMAASAAYAVASGATRIVSTTSGISGSIGVVMLHADYGHRLHEAGIVPTLIYAGPRKVDGNPYEKLTTEAKTELKSEIERFYGLFVATVAKFRPGLTEDAIRATESRTYIGEDALKAGLVDEIGSFESALADLSRGFGRSQATRGHRMATDKGKPEADAGTVSKADHDAAVAAARAEGVTAGKAEAKAEGDKAVADARKEGEATGAKAERERIKGIMSLEEAKGREAAAFAFATSTGMSVDEAKAALAGMPKAEPGRAGSTALGLSVEQSPTGSQQTAAASAWDDVIAKQNSALKAQRG